MSNYPKLERGFNLAAKRKTVTVDLPELECSVTLRELSFGQFHETDKTIMDQLRASIIDDAGNPLFETAEELLEMPYRAAERLTEAFLQLNGIAKESVEAAAKKSEAGVNTDSASA